MHGMVLINAKSQKLTVFCSALFRQTSTSFPVIKGVNSAVARGDLLPFPFTMIKYLSTLATFLCSDYRLD